MADLTMWARIKQGMLARGISGNTTYGDGITTWPCISDGGVPRVSDLESIQSRIFAWCHYYCSPYNLTRNLRPNDMPIMSPMPSAGGSLDTDAWASVGTTTETALGMLTTTPCGVVYGDLTTNDVVAILNGERHNTVQPMTILNMCTSVAVYNPSSDTWSTSRYLVRGLPGVFDTGGYWNFGDFFVKCGTSQEYQHGTLRRQRVARDSGTLVCAMGSAWGNNWTYPTAPWATCDTGDVTTVGAYHPGSTWQITPTDDFLASDPTPEYVIMSHSAYEATGCPGGYLQYLWSDTPAIVVCVHPNTVSTYRCVREDFYFGVEWQF